jgi:hypothetical protein
MNFALATLALIVLTAIGVWAMNQGGDWCLGGKGAVPCDWTPVDVKIIDDPKDK